MNEKLKVNGKGVEIMDHWFTVNKIENETIIISEYRHWEETHFITLPLTPPSWQRYISLWRLGRMAVNEIYRIKDKEK